MNRRTAKSSLSRRLKLGIATAVTGFLVLAGTTAGFAYWTASNTVTSTVGAATLSLSTANFTSVGYTFGNETLVTTGSVTVTNTTTTTSTQSGAVSVTFGPAASGSLAGKVTATIWTSASAANCTAAATVPSGATTALWSASPVLTSSLAKNASVIYCLRSSIATRETAAAAGGSLTFQPKISATITVGNFTGSASATTTQSTHYIYPVSTIDETHWNWIRPNFTSSYHYCLDVSGAGNTSGTIVISYSCKTSGVANQNWKFTASGAAGYYTIQPRGATGLRLDENSSTASGAGITVVTAAANAATAKNQQWQLQLVSAGVVQFVNPYSGMCLTSPSGTDQNLGNLTQKPCDGTVYQQFTVSQTIEGMTCTTSGNNYVWSWSPTTTTGPYHVLVTHGSTTTELAATASTAGSATLPFTVPDGYGTGTYNVSFVDANDTLVATGTITYSNYLFYSTHSCTGDDFQ